MSRLRQAVQLLGKSGITLVVALLLFAVFYFTGKSLLAFLFAVALIPISLIVLFRGFVWVKRHALWSLRNRLLVVYTLMGVLPIALLFVLIGLSGWALMNELAIYLASSALDRRLESLQSAVEGLQQLKPADRPKAVSHFAEAFEHSFPGITFYFNDGTGMHSYPPNAPSLTVAPGWGNVDGLLVWNGRFYGWAHDKRGNDEITVLAPFSNQSVENLVPNLGAIALLETDEHPGRVASAGAISSEERRSGDMQVKVDLDGRASSGRTASRIPPPVNRFDIPVLWPSTRLHYHLDTPG